MSIGEVNSVIGWLAGLTARYRLPQKLLVLHQFRLSMIRDERELDTRHDDLAILIHMDGQGTPADKQQTWETITMAAPPGSVLRVEEFLRQGPSDAESAADDRQVPAALHDLLSVALPQLSDSHKTAQQRRPVS